MTAAALREAARRHWPLLLVLGGHLLLGAAYGLRLPLFESPDEPGHYLYVRYLQAYRRLPVQTEVFEAPRAHHPPLYYALGALLTAAVDIPGSPDAITMQPNPKFGYEQGAPGSDNKAVFVHNGPEEQWPFRGQTLAVHLLRLLSLAFAALGVVATYAAAWRLRPGDAAFAGLAAGLVAFNPMVLYMSGLVNNDTSALASGAVVVWLVGRNWPLPPAPPPRKRRRGGVSIDANAEKREMPTHTRGGEGGWLLIGIALGLGLLLKSSALVLVVPVGLALAAGAVAEPRAWARHARRALAAFGPALAIGGWWYLRNLWLYGDFTGNAAVAIVSGRVPVDERWVNLPQKVNWLLQGLYGCGPVGPLSLCLPRPIYLTAAALAFLGLAGLVVEVRRARPDWRRSMAQLWLMHALTALATTGAVLVYALSYQNTWGGRFFFPAFLSLALLLAAGWLAWCRPAGQGRAGSCRSRIAVTLVLLNLAVGVYALVGQVLPRYGPPTTTSPVALSRAAPLEARLGEAAEVVGYRLDRQAVGAGEVLAVTVYWKPLAATPIPYTVFIHVFSPAHGSLAQRDTYPGLGTYPTTGWKPGRVFADTYRLRLAENVTVPDEAYIVLGLYDEATGERLPARGADAVPEESWVAFGEVTVQ